MIHRIVPFLVMMSVALAPVNLWAKGSTKYVSLTVGKAETLSLDSEMADVLVADPSVVDVGALKANQLYAIGLKNGNTNILVFDKAGAQIMRYDLQVNTDNSGLKGTLNSLLPGQDIRVTTVNNDVVLTGEVDNPMTASRARDIAARFTGENESVVNLMRVKAEQQVTLKVKIVEARKQKLKELGIETNLTLGDNTGSFAGTNIGTTPGTGLTVDPLGIGSLIYDLGGAGSINLLLNALERDGVVSTLAEPNLTAISGEQAGFLVGGEFPIPVSRDRDGNIVVDYKKFGVSLNFKPVVLGPDRISLQLSTEVSALSSNNAVTLNSVTLPSLTVRRAEATVELNSGGSLMMAGLLQSGTVAQMNQLPGGAKNIPVIGDLLKSQSFNRDETELLIMVTAYLVKPFAEKTEAARAEPTTGQDVTVTPQLDNDLQTKLRAKFGTKYDRALTASAGEGATYDLN